MKKEIKRGYVKWRDENGVLHKQRVEQVVEPELELFDERFGDDEGPQEG
jgi:hypothetical protein